MPKSLIDPEFAAGCDGISDEFAATQGRRSFVEQDGLYQQGRTTPGEIVTYAKAGQSPHNWGLAIDVARIGEDGKLHWDYDTHPAWHKLRDYVDGARLLHGGWHFPHPDEDHVQSTRWPQKRADLIASGSW